MLQVGVVVVFVCAAALYAVPSVVAALKGNRRWLPIVALNILLGWTIVGWLAALVLALEIAPRRVASRRPGRTRRKSRAIAVRPSKPDARPVARRDQNDPPEIREDVYAAWLDQGAGLDGGSRG